MQLLFNCGTVLLRTVVEVLVSIFLSRYYKVLEAQLENTDCTFYQEPTKYKQKSAGHYFVSTECQMVLGIVQLSTTNKIIHKASRVSVFMCGDM